MPSLLSVTIRLQVSMWILSVLGMSLSGFLSSFLVHPISLNVPVVNTSLNMVWLSLNLQIMAYQKILGYNDNPIAWHVQCLPTDYFLLTNQFHCKSGCGRIWQGTDPHILVQLSRLFQLPFLVSFFVDIHTINA